MDAPDDPAAEPGSHAPVPADRVPDDLVSADPVAARPSAGGGRGTIAALTAPLVWGLGGVLPLLGVMSGFAWERMGVEIAPTWFDLGAAVFSCVAVFVCMPGRSWARRRTLFGQLALGTALGIATVFALGCLPMLPLFLIACAFGLGFLALAPYWNLTALLVVLVHRRPLADETARRRRRLRQALVVGLLLYPSTVVWRAAAAWQDRRVLLSTGLRASRPGRMILNRSSLAAPGGGLASWSAERDDRLIDGLRASTLLASCYTADPLLLDFPAGLWRWPQPIGWRQPIGEEVARVARAAWFRARGTPFWTEPVPDQLPQTEWLATDVNFAGGRIEAAVVTPMDEPGGSAAARGPLPGLELTGSRLRIAPAERAAGRLWARVAWTFEVANHADVRRQTRMQFRVPPGGLVDGLHLWVGQARRPAVFADTLKVTEAYQEIAAPVEVRWGRAVDPALLRQVGPDRYRLVAYPVPARGEIRFRVDFTVQVRAVAGGESRIWLPTLIDRDVRLAADLVHMVEVDADLDAEPDATAAGAPQNSAVSSREGLAEQLRDSAAMHRPRPVGATDTAFDEGLPAWPHPGRRAVLLVDAFHGHDRELTPQLVEMLPEDAEVFVIHDGEPIRTDRRGLLVTAAGVAFRAPFQRHAGTVAVLRKVLAAADSPADILWLHGASTLQPPPPAWREVLAPELLMSGARLVALPMRSDLAPDTLVESLVDAGVAVQVFRAAGDLAGELRTLRAGQAWAWSADQQAVVGADETSPLAERLRARARHDVLLRDGDLTGAAQQARAQRLVTQTVGAVVLETDAQYREQGLAADASGPPPQPAGSPVPEPETWLLLLGGSAALIWLQRRRVA